MLTTALDVCCNRTEEECTTRCNGAHAVDAVWAFVHGKCAVLGMMVGCGASALESVLVAGGRVRPKGGASPMVGAHLVFFS